MANWAAERADQTIMQLNQINISTGLPFYQPYVEKMCSAGYTGPLCGACKEGFGHSGQRCVRCIHRSANSFVYFLVCLFMFIVPALQTLLHSKNVQNRHQLQRSCSGDLGSARHDSALSGPLTSIRQGSGRGWAVDQLAEESAGAASRKDIQMVPVVHQQSGGVGIGSATGDGTRPAHADQMNVAQTLTPYMSGVVPTALDNLAAAAAAGNVAGRGFSQAPSHSSNEDGFSASLEPWSGPDAADDTGRQHISKKQLPARLPAATAVTAAAVASLPVAQQPNVQQPSQCKLSSLLAHLFSTEALESTPSVSPLPAKGPAAAATTGDVYKPEYYHTDVMTVSAREGYPAQLSSRQCMVPQLPPACVLL